MSRPSAPSGGEPVWPRPAPGEHAADVTAQAGSNVSSGHEHAVPYASVFAATPTALVVLDPDFVIREVNTAYLEATGRSRDELIGRPLFEMFPGPAEAIGHLRASLERVRDTGKPDTMAVLRYDIPDGAGGLQERYWSPISVPILDEHGDTILLLHRAEDVTEFVRERQLDVEGHDEDRFRLRQAEADVFARARELQAVNNELRSTRDDLALHALHDPMTGLLNRPVLLEQLCRALSRAARHPHLVAVLFIDLDRLKSVNDLHGHAAGDRLIRCSAEQLKGSVRPCDAVARYGGDEFVVLLEDLRNDAEAVLVAARVLAALRACSGHPERSGASIGIAVATDAALSGDELISQADQAMYRAKRAGGDRYEVFEAGARS